jgi:hypothetical protein
LDESIKFSRMDAAIRRGGLIKYDTGYVLKSMMEKLLNGKNKSMKFLGRTSKQTREEGGGGRKIYS